MKLLSILLAVFILYGCATPSEPKLDDLEKEKLSYVEIKNTVGYVYDIALTEDFIYTAEDQAGLSAYEFDGTLVDTYFNGNMSARIVYAVPQDTMVYFYDRTGGPAKVIILSQFNIQEEALDPITGDTQNVKDMIPLYNADVPRIIFSGGTRVYSKFYTSTSFDGIEFGFWESYDAFSFPAPVNKIDLQGDRLYVTGAQLGIFVTEVDDYQITALTHTINTPGEAMDVKFVDNSLFVACKEEGFVVIDINDLDNPITTFHEVTVGWAQSIAVEGSLLAVGSGGGGVYVYDISTIHEPVFIGRITSDEIGYTYVVKIDDGSIYVGTKVGIFKIFLLNK